MSKSNNFGISGFSTYVPPFRVNLQQWCDWNGGSWDKIKAVVGHSFRMCSIDESVYTLAANAVLKLIHQYQLDPQQVGYLALGTESSNDNAVGTVIVRGLVDMALAAEGKPVLARDCEVPEFKQACLAGVYAMKGALRYLSFDGRGRQAIVVSSDIAEYALGSSGEPTQGAGAVAMLLEADPKLLELDLTRSGNASCYRGLDFRKPFLRFTGQVTNQLSRLHDFPVFNGPYSTVCYTDATLSALNALLNQQEAAHSDWLAAQTAIFMHRPYHHMPRSALAMGFLFALGVDAQQKNAAAMEELQNYCQQANVSYSELLEEMHAEVSVSRIEGKDLQVEPYPLVKEVLKVFRRSLRYRSLVDEKLRLGTDVMMGLGNLYSASVFAWIAAGLEQALEENIELAEQPMLLMGYGSGDAAEAIPGKVVAGWQQAAKNIRFKECLTAAYDLTEMQYTSLHGGILHPDLQHKIDQGFVIERVGHQQKGEVHDFGVEFYRYCGAFTSK